MSNKENELLDYKLITVARILKLSWLTVISLYDILEIKQDCLSMDEYENFYLKYFNYEKFEHKTYLLNDELFDLVSEAGCDSFTMFGEDVEYLFEKNINKPFNLNDINAVVNETYRKEYNDLVV